MAIVGDRQREDRRLGKLKSRSYVVYLDALDECRKFCHRTTNNDDVLRHPGWDDHQDTTVSLATVVAVMAETYPDTIGSDPTVRLALKRLVAVAQRKRDIYENHYIEYEANDAAMKAEFRQRLTAADRYRQQDLAHRTRARVANRLEQLRRQESAAVLWGNRRPFDAVDPLCHVLTYLPTQELRRLARNGPPSIVGECIVEVLTHRPANQVAQYLIRIWSPSEWGMGAQIAALWQDGVVTLGLPIESFGIRSYHRTLNDARTLVGDLEETAERKYSQWMVVTDVVDMPWRSTSRHMELSCVTRGKEECLAIHTPFAWEGCRNQHLLGGLPTQEWRNGSAVVACGLVFGA